MLVLRELSKRFYEIQRSFPRHTYSMESRITFITIVSAWKHISRDINEVARMLKMKQLVPSFTQFIKVYKILWVLLHRTNIICFTRGVAKLLLTSMGTGHGVLNNRLRKCALTSIDWSQNFSIWSHFLCVFVQGRWQPKRSQLIQIYCLDWTDIYETQHWT